MGGAMVGRLDNLFAEVLRVPVDTISDQTSPSNTPRWDSIAMINLALAIESEFGVKLSTREIMSMTTVGIAKGVLQKKGIAVV
jgi:acyl carrier protein